MVNEKEDNGAIVQQICTNRLKAQGAERAEREPPPLKIDEESWLVSKHDVTANGPTLDTPIDVAISEDIGVLEKELGQARKNRWVLFTTLWAHQIWWVAVIGWNIFFFILYSCEVLLARSIRILSVAHLTLTILVRNELLLCFLYWLFAKAPCFKYYAHRMLHSIGGLHVASGVATFVWFAFYVKDIVIEYRTGDELFALSAAVILVCLFGMIVFALRPIRERYHNTFEFTHRYLGWLATLMLVVHLLARFAIVPGGIKAGYMFSNPGTYLTFICVILVFYVWFTVRRPKIQVEGSQAACRIIFPGQPTMETGTFARVSTNFLEWHAFSVAITSKEDQTYSLIIARAGDWTSRLIDSVNSDSPPKKMYVRGVNSPGFMYMTKSYKRTVIIATGGGIAPVCPQITNKTSDIFLCWIARDHLHTYGEEVYEQVMSLGSNRILLHDTGKKGRPDVRSMLLKAVEEHGAQAVFVVSNEKYSQAIAQVCWRQGIPCYIATRDS